MTLPLEFEEPPEAEHEDGPLRCGLIVDGRRCGRVERHGHPVALTPEDEWRSAALATRRAERTREADEKAALAAPRTPQIPQRLATEAETPDNARRAAKAAEACGWTVETVYARGWRSMGANRALAKPRWADLIVMRAWKGPRQLVGVWIDGSFTVGFDERRTPHAWTPWRALIESES